MIREPVVIYYSCKQQPFPHSLLLKSYEFSEESKRILSDETHHFSHSSLKKNQSHFQRNASFISSVSPTVVTKLLRCGYVVNGNVASLELLHLSRDKRLRGPLIHSTGFRQSLLSSPRLTWKQSISYYKEKRRSFWWLQFDVGQAQVRAILFRPISIKENFSFDLLYCFDQSTWEYYKWYK